MALTLIVLVAVAGSLAALLMAMPRVYFALARDALDSKVEWHNLSVYDLSPDAVGQFDFVFMGSLLLHLRDPVLALSAVRSVTRGEFLSYDTVSPFLTWLHPRTPAARLKGTEIDWWTPNVAGLRRMIESAGFQILKSGGITFQKWRGRDLRLRGAPSLRLS